ncbi:MAG TPA: ABC transporter substrate-binding protein [Methylomirabilota bacterium]|jgi:peptide/nickel transport system substrate-binding protein|nr:ABC transporter substrate-binding protein [Methylomirabilota bacterium]
MRTLATLLLAGLVAATIPGQAPAATPKDTVVMAKQIDDIISMDPAESFEFSGSEAIGNVYERLIGYDLKNVSQLKGELAETWTVGADGRTYTFKMRKGIRFHSGNPVTAQDAAYSLQRAVALNKSPGFILTQFGFTKENMKERIRAVDDQTLVVETAEAVAPTFFYYCLTAVVGGIVDSKTVQAHEKAGDYGNEWLKTNSAGSGPFRLVSWKANEGYTLERVDGYWGPKALPRRVVVRHVPEPATQRLLLEKGDIDYARNLTKDQLDAIKGNASIAVQQAPKGSILYLGLNQKNPNLAKPEVREALKYLVDYTGIEQNILRGQYVVHQAFLPRGFLGALEDTPYKFDLERARALLAKAGLPNGFSVTMDVRNTSPITDIAQAIQASWAKAGIKLELIPGDGKQTLTKYRARNHDIYIGGWGPDYQDPHTNAETFAMNPDNSDGARSKTLAWRNSWDIPEMSKQTAAAVRERDAKKREAMYQQLQREHQKTSPFVIMFQQIEVAAHARGVDGFVMGPSFDNNLYAGIKK